MLAMLQRTADFAVTAVRGPQALKPANIQPGQRVLIHAGSGGVGTVAIQLAKVWGAYVVTTASGSNEKFLKVLRCRSEQSELPPTLPRTVLLIASVPSANVQHSITLGAEVSHHAKLIVQTSRSMRTMRLADAQTGAAVSKLFCTEELP